MSKQHAEISIGDIQAEVDVVKKILRVVNVEPISKEDSDRLAIFIYIQALEAVNLLRSGYSRPEIDAKLAIPPGAGYDFLWECAECLHCLTIERN